MSDLMLLGILRMPESSIEGDALSLMQFVQAARGAADRIEFDAQLIEKLRAELEASDQKRKEAILDAEKARDERNRAHVKLNAEWIEKTNALRAKLESFKQAVLDPENQPSQYGTVLLEAAAADKRDAWHMVCGDWRDETVALHGANGHIASGLTVDQARAIIGAHGGTVIAEAALAQRQGEGS